jgi:hypothetical protein
MKWSSRLFGTSAGGSRLVAARLCLLPGRTGRLGGCDCRTGRLEVGDCDCDCVRATAHLRGAAAWPPAAATLGEDAASTCAWLSAARCRGPVMRVTAADRRCSRLPPGDGGLGGLARRLGLESRERRRPPGKEARGSGTVGGWELGLTACELPSCDKAWAWPVGYMLLGCAASHFRCWVWELGLPNFG